MASANVDKIIRYHEETKHHLHRFARSAGYMDWNNQPNPFRFYDGEKPVSLPLLKNDPFRTHPGLYERENNVNREFVIENIAGFLELSLGLSAWKSISGSRWSLRINPSSGNLHPTEAYLIVSASNSIDGGVYHYSPYLHALELRCKLPQHIGSLLKAQLGTDGFLVALTSIFWRESWKYGERALRYCHHDVGHALACLSFAANIFGWQTKYLNALSDSDIATVLGLDKTRYPQLEEEHPDLLCFVCPNAVEDVPRSLGQEILSQFETMPFIGRPNSLSGSAVDWSIIYQAAALVLKPETDERRYTFTSKPFVQTPASQLSATEIIRNRRSATDFALGGAATREQFLSILDRTIPRAGRPPFDVELIDPGIHLLVFVHAVEGLAKGMYMFFRNDGDMAEMQQLTRPEFLWETVEEGFPLYALIKGDYRKAAQMVSCDQAIAGDSAFSMGMIARFEAVVAEAPYRYRHLFWEAGMIGQVLYLEAEAHGLGGTGIGCFFDDEVHDMLGFHDRTYQSIYHFTVGKPLEDKRLTVYPPYSHLEDMHRSGNARKPAL